MPYCVKLFLALLILRCWKQLFLKIFYPVAPDTIHNHVKTYRDERRNMHFIAPEYGMYCRCVKYHETLMFRHLNDTGWNNYNLLNKRQWNTRWAFAWKHDIFTKNCENNMLSSHMKRSQLLWLHDKSHLSQQKNFKVKWFGISFFFIW